LGVALGFPILWSLEVQGLNLGGDGGVSVAGIAVGSVLYGQQDFSAYAQAAVGLALTALAAALYPALRAARFRPAEALRKV
ncbi:MAG: lipoprotein-releasing system transmembrane subunit LolC, partial [Tepidisphaeraceae bacterium]